MPRLRTICKHGAIGLSIAGVGLIICFTINANRFKSRQVRVPTAPQVDLNASELTERLSGAIKIATVSTQNSARADLPKFVEFQSYLRAVFPDVHLGPLNVLTGTEFGDPRNLSLLYHWPGSDPALPAMLALAHYDVVPVEPETVKLWTHPPFAGHSDDEFVWGRGALDSKDSVCAWMEAATYLRREGFHPERSIYLALGHDEELGGLNGNKRIAQWMHAQGIRLHLIIDEGGCILNGFPGVSRPVALIGIGEKGYASLELSARIAMGGHSSMPPNETAIGILAAGLQRLQTNPLPTRLDGGANAMLDFVGPEMDSLLSRLAVANRWCFSPVVKRLLEATPSGNAALRTTVVPTMIRGGIKENVLPTSALATLNIRLLPGDTIESLLAQINSTLNDPRIDVRLLPNAREAPPISDPLAESFQELQRTVTSVYPEVIVAPFVLVGGTDSIHYVDLCPDIYRITPVRLNQSELTRIHGIDERIARRDYIDLVRFYIELMKNIAGPSKS